MGLLIATAQGTFDADGVFAAMIVVALVALDRGRLRHPDREPAAGPAARAVARRAERIGFTPRANALAHGSGPYHSAFAGRTGFLRDRSGTSGDGVHLPQPLSG